MKCVYCGAEVRGEECPYCGSELVEYVKKSDLKKKKKIDEDEEYDEDEYDEDEYDEDEDEDGDDEITEEMIDDIRKICHRFYKKYPNDFSYYDEDDDLAAGDGVNDKLFEVLEIPEDDEIFLIHDDTLFGSGKNGFAITSSGFYCKTLTDELDVTLFEEIEEDDEVNYENGVVYLEEDETNIAYCSGSDDRLEELCDTIDKIISALFE